MQRLAIVDERERIGKDLHDGIIQNIYAVGLSLEDIPEFVRDDPEEVERRVERAIDSLHVTIRDIRNFIFGLRPELLSGATPDGRARRDRRGVPPQLDDRCRAACRDDGPRAGRRPRPRTCSASCNEALSNIARHSGATRAWSGSARNPTAACAFGSRTTGAGSIRSAVGSLGHQGLANMRSRVATVGATMDIESDATGTRIEIHRPANGADADEEIATP